MEAHRIVIDAREVSEAKRRPLSLIRHSPALILIVIAIADIQRWADPDLWGHVAFGRAMLATRHLAFHDPYSYSAPGHLWLNHEWLSELVMGAAYDFGGVIGLKLMRFGCGAAAVVSLALALAETDSPIPLQLAILLAAGIAIAPHMQFRPQLFTYALMSALLAILVRYTYRGSAAVWLVIPILALWANLHGGFIVGLAALAIFTVVRTTTDIIGGRGARVGMMLLAVLIASTLVTAVTPYGFSTWHAVATAMTNPRTREVIVDWQPLAGSFIAMWRENHAATIPIIVAIAMFLTLAVTVVLNPRCGDFALVAIALVMTVAAVIAMRNLPLAVIATVIALARHASAFVPSERPPHLSRLNQGLLAAIGISILLGSGLLSDRLRAGDPRPVGAINFMTTNHLSGNIMTDFGWGEYIIWHMAPTSKVFIDGRYDTVYPPEVIDDYLDFHSGRGKDFLGKYPHDFVMLSLANKPELELMAAARDWKQLYRDANCILLVRTDSAAAKIPPVVVSPQRTPPSFFP